CHGCSEADVTDDAVASVMAALASRAATDLEAFQKHREAPFQHFRIRQQAVGGMGLNRIRTVETGPGARAAANRLIVLVLAIAEGEVVHGPLRGGEGPKS